MIRRRLPVTPPTASSRRHNHKTHHHYAVYGLTCGEFDRLLERARHGCELCLKDPPPITGTNGRVTTGLLIDHDHSTDTVRGLLCSKCNAHMRRVDSGERPIDAATATYLARTRQGERPC